MVVGTLPILLIGLGIKFVWAQGYEQSPLRSVPSIAIVSIVMALLLALAERVGARCKRLPGVSGRDGLLVGLAQALALIPGVSRSGSTLTAALFDGWQRADAARFSFLLGIPAIPREQAERRFPTILDRCDELGLNPLERPIPVAPAAHYWMGGVATDLQAALSANGF